MASSPMGGMDSASMNMYVGDRKQVKSATQAPMKQAKKPRPNSALADYKRK